MTQSHSSQPVLKPIRAGVIGFGLGGRIFHAAVIAATPGLELAAVVQRSSKSAAEVYPDIAIAHSLDELLADDSIQLVAVSSPSGDHYAHAKQCLEAGRHVMVDKPFTLTSAEARDLIDLATSKGLVLAPYQNRRWDGDFVTLKQVLASGALGRIVTYESHFDRFRQESRTNWKENGVPGGGLLLDLGPHLIDQACSLFGNPESVWADVRIDREGSMVVDAFDIELKFAHGLSAWLRSSLTACFRGPRFLVHGTQGSFVKWGLDPQEPQLLAGMEFTDAGFGEEPESDWGTLHIDGKADERVPTVRGDYRSIYANLRDAILGIAPLEVTAEHAWRTARIIELAIESSQTGRRFTYPD
ncbi:Gfo/Idh/MocA family oxidoreductase [Silvibacterium dinghuense]|uniref:Oxidoreductase n=1 Tax=Silvibacterium dinghuense TaxID=1560006 RepID=A0A4Q1SE25_9BACT|nr:Gfo/Idh/MocA family oxidoreductase [Silvibacterium dinghuense]RXS95373.1 oxidoreductase [Silvibacterium dinghuense]GGH12758.1 oxidoreductase [Silvibacterium dinghuense]